MANPFLNIFSGALGEANTQRQNTQQLQQALQTLVLQKQLQAKIRQMFDPEAQFRNQIMKLISGQGGGQPGMGQPTLQPQQPSLQSIISQMPQDRQPAMSLPSGGIGDVQGRPVDLAAALSRTQAQPQTQSFGQQPSSAGGFRPTGFSYGGFTFENPEEKMRMKVEEVKALREARGPTPAEQWNKIRIQNEDKVNKQKSESVKNSASGALQTIAEIEKRMGSFGLFGDLPSIPGTQRKNWEVNINKLVAENVLKVMNDLKTASRTGATGFGQLSNKELDLLKDASTALKRSLNPKDAQRYIDQIKKSMNKIIEEQGDGVPSGQSDGQQGGTGQSFQYLWQ